MSLAGTMEKRMGFSRLPFSPLTVQARMAKKQRKIRSNLKLSFNRDLRCSFLSLFAGKNIYVAMSHAPQKRLKLKFKDSVKFGLFEEINDRRRVCLSLQLNFWLG
ncbi:MAG: hypothetical protein ACAH59_02405 [Pseudobdellovibrionaceae bacterium]